MRDYEIPYDNIIFNLLHCKRYLINDYSDTNPYPTCISKLKRNDNSLKELSNHLHIFSKPDLLSSYGYVFHLYLYHSKSIPSRE